MESDRSRHHERLFDDLVASAVCAGAPAPVAEVARRATAARFSGTAPARSTARVHAYFWGVVRRRALAGEAPCLAQSLLIASLAAELTEAGHAPDVIRREVARVYGREGAGPDRTTLGESGRAA
jgi:hypothetical protein